MGVESLREETRAEVDSIRQFRKRPHREGLAVEERNELNKMLSRSRAFLRLVIYYVKVHGEEALRGV